MRAALLTSLADCAELKKIQQYIEQNYFVGRELDKIVAADKARLASIGAWRGRTPQVQRKVSTGQIGRKKATMSWNERQNCDASFYRFALRSPNPPQRGTQRFLVCLLAGEKVKVTLPRLLHVCVHDRLHLVALTMFHHQTLCLVDSTTVR